MVKRSAAFIRQLRSGIEAIALDAYGTVIDFTEPDFIIAMAEICTEQGLDADAGDVWKRFLRAAYDMRAENHDRPVYKTYREAWAHQFERVFEQLKLPGDARTASDHLKKRLTRAPVYDEAAPAIAALRAEYPVALLSNADNDFLHACLERNRLKFDLVESSEDAKAIKPHPDIFRHLAKRMGLPVRRILYAGDNPIPDVLGPARAGMKVAWVNRTGMRKPRNIPYPDLRVKSLTELVRILVPTGD